MSTDTAPPPSPPLPPPPRAPGGLLRALWQLLQPVLSMLLLLALVGGAVAAVLVWLLRSDEGTAWLMARLPGVEVSGTQGALLSDRFAAERFVVRWDKGRQWVALDGFVGSGLQWDWHPAPGAWIGLRADRLAARRVEVQTGPRSPRPIVMPRSMQLPLRLHAARVEVGELRIDDLEPMLAVQGTGARLWEPGGREYHAEHVRLEWHRAQIEGQVSLGALPPFTLQAQARARSIDGGPVWSAEARAQGPLARFDLHASLQGQPGRAATAAAAAAAAPSLQLDAVITPLEAWPLGALRLATQSLDLSALSSRAPRTALSGQAEVDTRALDAPVSATLQLVNALPGRWDEGRAPLRRVQARLRSPDAQRNRLLLESFDIEFARAAEDAGRWQGSGQWNGTRLQLTSRLDALRPQLLDSRAAVMSLSGPLALEFDGLPPPDPRSPAPGKPADWSAVVRTELDGRIERSPLPVQLAVEAQADAKHVDIRQLRAQAGSAHATLSAQVRRAAQGAWQLRSSGVLADFDPLPWWPGPEGSPWRAGPHRFTGGWTIDLSLPRPQPGQPPLAWLQTLAGSGQLRLERSQLAGVPLVGQVELAQRPEPGLPPARVSGELLLGGNRLLIEGRGDPLGEGAQDRLQLDLQAPLLSALAPLARLHPASSAWQPRSGALDGQLTLEGRWPALRSEGRAELQTLKAGAVDARQLQARWRFDTASDQPLMLQLDGQGLAQGEQRLEQLRADLRGTWARHRIDASVALPGQPPPLLERAFALRRGQGLQAQLRGEGQWRPDGSGGGRWSGQVAELHLGPWAGASAPAPTGPGSTWLRATELRTELRWDARQGLVEWLSGAGQMRLADAVTLRWDEVRVDFSGAAPAFTLRADVEPFALAPFLARAQPDMGWSGDLQLAARVDLKVAEQVDADFVFERRSGDLQLSEEATTIPFGLNEMRVVVSAHDGLWQLAGAFAGKALGEASARLSLRPKPQQRWPDAETPIDGVVEAHVANLGIWGTWVPPGWRLSGDLRTRARVSGRVGAPDYTGEISASDVSLRNLLLGVDLRQGEALVKLAGTRAEIERFRLQGGEGSLAISGHASLAGQPQAQLTLQAERFRVLGRVDRQLTASAQLGLLLGAERLRVDGRVRVDEGLFDLGRSDAPSLDEDVSIRQAPVAEAEAQPAPPQRTRRNQQVAVELDLGEKLRVRGRGLDALLGGQLRLGSTAGRLTLNGIVSAAGGTYAAYGQKLEIERGLLVFTGAPDNPTLDVLALRPDIDVQVGVAITGTPQAPRVRLYAGSDMSESDKLSWLVLGRPSDGLGRADTALLQRAAVALLAGEGEAPTDALLRNLGLDQLSVRQSDSDVRETVVSLGKQLSRRWYVGYERGVNATTGTWQLIYRIAQRFTLRAQSGLENSLDLIWVWRLDDDPLVRPPQPKPLPGRTAMPESGARVPP